MNRYGNAAPKNEDLTVCLRCHAKVHPKNTGQPDYIWAYRPKFLSEKISVATLVEVKACQRSSEDRIKLVQIEDEQRKWIRRVNPWWFSMFFILVGSGRVNSKAANRRRAWLIPSQIWFDIEDQISQAKLPAYIPLEAKRGIRQDKFTLTSRPLNEWELQWSEGGWAMAESVQKLLEVHMLHRNTDQIADEAKSVA
jgi:hypothetical protein